MIETREGVDWAVGEAIGFATMLLEGNHIRLSGQYVESHTRSVLHDQETGERYWPLDHVVMNQHDEMFTVSNRLVFMNYSLYNSTVDTQMFICAGNASIWITISLWSL